MADNELFGNSEQLDTISRAAAIDALDGEIEITGRTNAEAVKGYVRLVRDRLERLPSARPEQWWIPCSEKLPEDGQNVLVTYKTTNKIHPCQYHDDGSRNPWYSYIDQCRAYMNVVTA